MPNEFDSVIDAILIREGGSKVTNTTSDKGGRTQWGISEKANPEAWADGKVSEAEAREIYLQKYVIGPGFHTIPPSHKTTQAHLIDFGVNSGPAISIQKLQEILKVKPDGVVGPKTLAAMVGVDDRTLNNQLVVSRVKMIARLVQRHPGQVKFLSGWLNRATCFIR